MNNSWLIAMLLTSIPLHAIGITPASREQLMCNSTHIVVGEIIETDIKCQPSQWGVGKECQMLFSVKIAKAIATARKIRDNPDGVGIKDAGVEPGVTMELKSWYPNGYRLEIPLADPSPEAISKELKGRSFILSINSGFGLWLGGLPLKREAATQYSGVVERFDRPYYSTIWDLQKISWVAQAISKSASCSNFELSNENR